MHLQQSEEKLRNLKYENLLLNTIKKALGNAVKRA